MKSDFMANSTTTKTFLPPSAKLSRQTVKAALKKHHIDYVRVIWCDNSGIIRAKAMYADKFSAGYKNGVNICRAQQVIPTSGDVVVSAGGLQPVGEVQLIPDLITCYALPFTPGHASTLGDMYDQGKPWHYCPRDFLKRMIKKARGHKLHFSAAFENEFYLLSANGDQCLPTDQTVFAAALGIDSHYDIIKEISDALLAQDIRPNLYHVESGPGQHELSITHQEPLNAADQQLMLRQTVQAIAYHYGLIGTFVAKPFAEQAGSGAHLHISIWKNLRPLLSHFDDIEKMDPLARHFIAGLYHHLPALMALTTSTCNSFTRFIPRYWSGAFQGIGIQNRETAIRLIPGNKSNNDSNIELKAIDGTCNPYLAMGAVIAAGLDGIDNQLALPPFVDVDPANLTKAQQKRLQVAPLPANLGEAIRHLKSDHCLLEALGTELAQAIIAVREHDWQFFKDKSADEEVKILLTKF